MRNRYAEVLGTYRRLMFLWWFITWLPALLGFLIEAKTTATAGASTPSRDLSSYPTGFWIAEGAPFAYLGGALAVHLKEMFGNAMSRLTPRLFGPHFVIAGLLAVVVTVLLPALVALGARDAGSLLPVIAFTAATFSFGVVLMHWFPKGVILFFVAPYLLNYLGSTGLASQAATSRLAIVLSVAGLAAIVLRLRSFTEELPEFNRRLPNIGFGWNPLQPSPGQLSSAWGLWNPVPPIRKDLGALRRDCPVWRETLWSRARHWDAGWRSQRRAAQECVWVAVVFFAITVHFRLHYSHVPARDRPSLLGFPLVLLSQFAVTTLWGTVYWNRGSLICEFLRPYSRAQYVRAVGLMLVAATATALVLQSTAVFASSCLFGAPASFDNRVLREWLYAASVLPLFFAATVWPFAASSWRLGNYVYTLIVLVPALFAWEMICRLANGPFFFVVVSVGTAGCLITRRMYRRWLDHEVT